MGESVERLDKSPWVRHIGARKRGDGKGRRKGGMEGLKGSQGMLFLQQTEAMNFRYISLSKTCRRCRHFCVEVM